MTTYDALPDALFPAFPVCWPFLDDQAVEECLDALSDWVDWLVQRYALDHRTIPPCWSEHGALVEELSALRTGWLAAFAMTSRPEAPLEWHHHFGAARLRLTAWSARTGCRPSEHRGDR
jgi:hypothetical protein